MPAPLRIKLKDVTYITPILNGEMDNIAQQIYQVQDEMRSLREHLQTASTNLSNLNSQLVAMYVQQTGQFPDSLS